MKNKQTSKTKNKKKKMSTLSKILLFIVLGVLAYTVVMVINQQLTIKKQQDEWDVLSEQKQQLETDKSYYENELEYMNSDEYVEKEAKERLGWVSDDETKYIIQE